jgi:hypothetical protein
MGFDVDLQWFSDEQPVVDEAAIAAEIAPEEGQATDFNFDHTFDDGQRMEWKSPDELRNYLKESSLRQSDYTRKTQGLAEERKKWEADRQAQADDFKKQLEEFQKVKGKYDTYAEAFKRRPMLAKQIDQMVNQPVGANEVFTRSQSYADEKFQSLEQRLEAFEKAREEEKLQAERDRIMEGIKKEYPGLDDAKFNQALEGLDGQNLEPLMKMIARASMYDPVKAQAAAEELLQEKQQAKLAGGGGGPTPKSTGSTNIEEVHQQAMKELGIT